MSPLLYTWWWPRISPSVPIVLMLHSVAEEIVVPVTPNNTVRPSELEALAVRLRRNGYTFQTLSEAVEKPCRRSVVLTFDDGCRDNYEVLFPLAMRLDLRATCFVTDRGGSDLAFLSAGQIREMDASGRFEFGGHTSHHSTLTDIEPPAVRREIRENKARLEEILGHPVCSFSYPCGRYTPEIVEEVRAAGYRLAVTMEKKMRPPATDPLHIHRQIIPRGLDPAAAYILVTRGRYKL